MVLLIRTAHHKPTNKDEDREVGGVMCGIIGVVYDDDDDVFQLSYSVSHGGRLGVVCKVAQLWHSPFWG